VRRSHLVILLVGSLLSGCGSLKEGNPLLLPLAIPLVIGVESVMALNSPYGGQTVVKERAAWNPLTRGGSWVSRDFHTDHLSVAGNLVTLETSCRSIIADAETAGIQKGPVTTHRVNIREIHLKDDCYGVYEPGPARIEISGNRFGERRWISVVLIQDRVSGEVIISYPVANIDIEADS
tara:strand:+ start:538 stop:1074 length:537 start_codon:yes stop_codon:yes gene_type:complete